MSASTSITLKVPKPKEFRGKREAKEVNNFFWGVEQYFKAMGITDHALKVNTAAMYLTDIALLWWRGRCDVKLREARITTWQEFQKEL